MRKFINITENFVEATRPINRFSKNPRISITVPDSVYEKISKWMHNYDEVDVTVDELRKNPKVLRFIEYDINVMYWEQFDEGFENMDLADELGYGDRKPSDDDDI